MFVELHADAMDIKGDNQVVEIKKRAIVNYQFIILYCFNKNTYSLTSVRTCRASSNW